MCQRNLTSAPLHRLGILTPMPGKTQAISPGHGLKTSRKLPEVETNSRENDRQKTYTIQLGAAFRFSRIDPVSLLPVQKR